jgi:hypothetical protein
MMLEANPVYAGSNPASPSIKIRRDAMPEYQVDIVYETADSFLIEADTPREAEAKAKRELMYQGETIIGIRHIEVSGPWGAPELV